MEAEGCRGKVIREIVEIKESEGEGEGEEEEGQGEGQGEERPGRRKGERKCLVCLKEWR